MWKIGIEKVATCDPATILRALRPSQQCINRYSIATARKYPKLCRVTNVLGLHFSPHLTWYRHPCRTMENREKVTTCHQTSGFYNAEPQAEYRNRFGTTMKYYHEIKMSKVVWAITLSRWLGLHLPRWKGIMEEHQDHKLDRISFLADFKTSTPAPHPRQRKMPSLSSHF